MATCTFKKFSFFILGFAFLFSRAASAGPPGVLDDPHSVGAGVLEVILGTAALEQAGDIGVDGPILDLTLGVRDGFDFLLVGSLGHAVDSDPDESPTGLLATGFKWQPVQGDEWNLSLTPTVAFEIEGDELISLNLSIQVERTFRRLAVGLDGLYTWTNDDSHTWQGGIYGLYQASDRLHLLAEIWVFESGEEIDPGPGAGGLPVTRRGNDVSFNLGFDWESPLGVHVLASAGSGVTSSERERVAWQTFFGLQWILPHSIF